MDHQIGPTLKRRWRQLGINARCKVTAMGLIHQHRPALLMQQRDQRTWIRGIALIGGMQQHGCSDGLS